MKTAAIFSTQNVNSVDEYKQKYSHLDPTVLWDNANGNNWKDLATILEINIEEYGGKARRAIDRTAEKLHGKVAPKPVSTSTQVQQTVKPVPTAPKPSPATVLTKAPVQAQPVSDPVQTPASKVNGHHNGHHAEIEAAKALTKALELLIPKTSVQVDECLVRQIVSEEIAKLNVPQGQTIQVQLPGGQVNPVGVVHECFEQILFVASCRKNAYLVGPAGSGKTHTCKQVADALGLPFYSLSVCAQSSKTDLLGYQSITSGEYIRTSFREAYEHGGIFLLDEIDNGNPNVLSVLNASLSNGFCQFPDAQIDKHPDFIVLACANTYGQGADRLYVGRNQLDGATLDRFSFIEFPYDEKLELSISPNEKWTRFVQDVRKELSGERVIVSPRASIDGGTYLNAGARPELVVKMTIKKGLPSGLCERIDKIARLHKLY